MKFCLLLSAMMLPLCAAEVRPLESPPKKIGDLEFSVIGYDFIGNLNSGSDRTGIQLHVKNVSPEEKVFPISGHIELHLRDADGKEAFVRSKPKKPLPAPTLRLGPGEEFCYPLEVIKGHAEDTKKVDFSCALKGGVNYDAILAAGSYRLSVAVGNFDSRAAEKPAAPAAGEWTGEGETESVVIRVGNPS